jgi:hypothetical protein
LRQTASFEIRVGNSCRYPLSLELAGDVPLLDGVDKIVQDFVVDAAATLRCGYGDADCEVGVSDTGG